MQRKPFHFLILGCAALLLHAWALTIEFKFLPSAENSSTTSNETSLLLQIQKVIPVIPEPLVDSVETVETVDPQVTEVKGTPSEQEEVSEIDNESDNKTLDGKQAPPRALVSQHRLQAFVSDMVNEELKNPSRVASFQSTFNHSIASSPSGTQIEEQENGNISVQTKMFGKAVCYDFAADGDPPLAFFKDCPKNDIQLNLDR